MMFQYDFGRFSGLKLNRNKTEGLWIGAAKNSENKPCNINWSSGPIKALGIHFGLNHDQCTILNWDNKLDKCKQIIKNC